MYTIVILLLCVGFFVLLLLLYLILYNYRLIFSQPFSPPPAGLASTEVDHADGLLQLQMERHPNVR